MNRTVFEKINMEGFRTQKVETISVTSNGLRMFVGTSDGNLTAYECYAPSNTTYAPRNFNCNILTTMRNQTKEKKPVQMLTPSELWGVIIGIVDGIIMAYDINTLHLKSQLADTKGCNLFSIHEKSFTLAVVNKKKLSIFTWQQGISAGFTIRRELNLSDSPKVVFCVNNAVVIGYKRHYESIDLTTMNASRLVDVDKEHKMACAEIPATFMRLTSLLLSVSTQGVVLDLSRPLSSSSPTGERLEWSSSPLSITCVYPYLLSLLSDGSCEVHDLCSLASLQRISFTGSPSSLSSCSQGMGGAGGGPGGAAGLELGYVGTSDQVTVLRMTPLSAQVSSLVETSLYEDAINLCSLCKGSPLLRDIDVPRIHEKFAYSLYQKGDFDGAIQNYISAGTNPSLVLSLFPDLIPPYLHAAAGIGGGSGSGSARPGGSGVSGKMSGQILHRAAASLVQFCEHHSPTVRKRADLAERLKQSGGLSSGMGGMGLNLSLSMERDPEMSSILDPDEALSACELLETVLLTSLVNCSPPRKLAVVDLLSSANRCHLESSAVVLSSQGPSFTEGLLWLFRSHGEHRRVLGSLTEERCVGAGAWSREQFYSWTAEYLRFLWGQEDPSLPAAALASPALRGTFEYDADLGMSVLTRKISASSSSPNSPSSSSIASGSSFVSSSSPLASSLSGSGAGYGGRGVTVSEILRFLESCSPKTSFPRALSFLPAASPSGTGGLREAWAGERRLTRVMKLNPALLPVPILNGRSLSLAYLEWLVSTGGASPSYHDDYAQMLIEGLPGISESEFDLSSSPPSSSSSSSATPSSLDLKEGDPESLVLYKILRRKLQSFLQTSSDYQPERVLRLLPPSFLRERALALSRLGRHQEVLSIYVHQLQSLSLAEEYCERIYKRSFAEERGRKIPIRGTGGTGGVGGLVHGGGSTTGSLYSSEERGVFLILVKVILAGPPTPTPSSSTSSSSPSSPSSLESLPLAMQVAEKHFSQLDSLALLALLPPGTPLSAVSKYLSIVMEFGTASKRNLQITHQLLRMREVDLRIESGAGLGTTGKGGSGFGR